MRGIVELSHGLGLTVVAEHVADEERQTPEPGVGGRSAPGSPDLPTRCRLDELRGWLDDTGARIGPSQDGARGASLLLEPAEAIRRQRLVSAASPVLST